MSEWQPIDTAPKDVPVLLYDRFERDPLFARFVGCCIEKSYEFPPESKSAGKVMDISDWTSIPGAYKKRPTHWMPLPEPP